MTLDPGRAEMIDSRVRRLARLDSSAVSDALDKLGLSGAISGIERLSTNRRIAGRILTVTLGMGGSSSRTASHLGTAAIEAAKPGDIIAIQHPGIDAAGWGGILSLGAKRRSVAGVIVDGPVRDIDDSRAIEFPVFARGVTPRTARGRIAEVAFNEPITIGGVQLSSGDFAIADGSGVVLLAANNVDRILEVAETLAARERAMTAALLDGAPVGQVMGADYEQSLKGR